MQGMHGKDCSIGVESTTQCPLLHSLMYIDIADHTIATFGTGRDENFQCSPIPSGTACHRTQSLTFNSFRMRLATVQHLGTLHHFLHVFLYKDLFY